VHGLAATVYVGLCHRLPDARRAPAALSPAGRRLDQLQRLPGREPGEEEEFERLRRLPVEALVAFDDMPALTSADEARLQNRLVDALLGRCPDAEAVGRRIARQLLPVLRAGLAPDPRVREKRVGPLYAALADAAEEVERALRGRETVVVEPVPPAAARLAVQAEAVPPALPDLGPLPSTVAVVTEPAALPRPAYTAPDAIAAFLERANIRGERSLGRTRLVLIAAALLSEVFAHTPAAWRSLAPEVWASSVVLFVGAALTVLLLRLRPERVRPTLAAWVSVALDAALVTGTGLPGAVWPVEGYPGQAHLPSFAFFLLAIVASAMRLSRPVLRFSVLCNSLGAALLLLIDARTGAAVLPTSASEFVLWVALFLGAAFIGDAIAVRTRRMVYEGAGSALKAERARQALGVYVSEEIAAEAMASDVLAPGGRRQAVAVLYCELNGFSRYAERVSPERLLTELNGFLEVMVQVVRANGGVVDRYLGDAILVVFGVPRPAADSSSRAVNAAAGMMAALRQHNEARAGRGLPALTLGIGVHAGEVVVGNIGTPERMQYTVIGDAVNLASHLQKASAQLGVPVLVSDVVARTVGVLDGATQLVPAGDVVVGGRSGPMAVWTLVEGAEAVRQGAATR
jgi:class 3 adenylate cyclase